MVQCYEWNSWGKKYSNKMEINGTKFYLIHEFSKTNLMISSRHLLNININNKKKISLSNKNKNRK